MFTENVKQKIVSRGWNNPQHPTHPNRKMKKMTTLQTQNIDPSEEEIGNESRAEIYGRLIASRGMLDKADEEIARLKAEIRRRDSLSWYSKYHAANAKVDELEEQIKASSLFQEEYKMQIAQLTEELSDQKSMTAIGAANEHTAEIARVLTNSFSWFGNKYSSAYYVSALGLTDRFRWNGTAFEPVKDDLAQTEVVATSDPLQDAVMGTYGGPPETVKKHGDDMAEYAHHLKAGTKPARTDPLDAPVTKRELAGLLLDIGIEYEMLEFRNLADALERSAR